MEIKVFTGSNNWCYRFMRRNRLSVRAQTSLGQKLPIDWEEKVALFRSFVSNIKTKVEDLHIGNMDDVPVNFDIPSYYTVDQKGTKDIKITTTGHEKCSFTVVLCVTANGGKLPPMVIIKRKTLHKGDIPKEIVVRVNPQGWMNKELMIEWLEE